MSETRVDDTDSRIEYWGSWDTVRSSSDGRSGDGVYHSATGSGSEFFIQFRGVAAGIYAYTGAGGGVMQLSLDGRDWTPFDLSRTQGGDNYLWGQSFDDGDHQVHGRCESWDGRSGCWLDGFSLRQASGQSIQPINVGVTASSIPANAAIIDDNHSAIVKGSGWFTDTGLPYYGGSTAVANVPGAKLTFSFRGTAVWYYADLDSDRGNVAVSVDGGQAETINLYRTPQKLSRRMVWSKQGLSDGLHQVTIAHADTSGKRVSLDYFRILGTPETPGSGNSNPQDPQTTSSTRSNARPVETTTTGSSTQSTGTSSSSTGSRTITGGTVVTRSDGQETTLFDSSTTVSGSGSSASTPPSISISIVTTNGSVVTVQAPPTDTNQNPQEPSTNVPLIAGAIVGAVVGLIILFGLIWFYLRRRRLSREQFTARPPRNGEVEQYQPPNEKGPMLFPHFPPASRTHSSTALVTQSVPPYAPPTEESPSEYAQTPFSTYLPPTALNSPPQSSLGLTWGDTSSQYPASPPPLYVRSQEDDRLA